MKFYVLKIVGNTAADGPGLRTSVYLAGCSHHCPGCHNPQSWNMLAGTVMTLTELVAEIESYGNRKVTLTGGDPMEHNPDILHLIRHLKKKGYNVWLYTGYTLEQLQKHKGSVFEAVTREVDGLVDGPFIQELRDTSLRFRGSSNQKIYLRDSQGNLREDTTQYSS